MSTEKKVLETVVRGEPLEGAQDVAKGVQFGALFGRQMQAGADGWFIASALYAGMGTPRSFLGIQAGVESARSAGDWNDMIAAGRLAWYSRPSRRRTRIASLEYSGGWKSTVPFQLQLGTARAGVRGYDDSFTAGGRRAVLRVEERLIFPGFSKYLGFPFILGAGELAVFCGAIAGAGLAFLWFNAYPAEVFMGDVGALALGAALGMVALVVRQEIVLFIMGGVFVVETLSVIIPVASFKLTGKRIFRMAPLHHHYELKGWKENQVVVRFWIITMMLVLFGLSTLKLR